MMSEPEVGRVGLCSVFQKLEGFSSSQEHIFNDRVTAVCNGNISEKLIVFIIRQCIAMRSYDNTTT